MNCEADRKQVQKKSFLALKQLTLKHPWKLFIFFCTVQTTVWIATTQAVLTSGRFLEEPDMFQITVLFGASGTFFLLISFMNANLFLSAALSENNYKNKDETMCFDRKMWVFLASLSNIMSGLTVLAVTVSCGRETKRENITESVVPALIFNLLWVPLFLVLTHNICDCEKCQTSRTKTHSSEPIQTMQTCLPSYILPIKMEYTITYKNERKSFKKGTKLTRKDLCAMFHSLENELIFVCDEHRKPIIELDTETSSFNVKEKQVFLKTVDDF